MSGVEWVFLAVVGPIDLVALVIAWRNRNRIDRMISTAVNRWLVARHKPEDIGAPERWCFTCRKPWPCAEWAKLHEAHRETAKS